MISVIGTSDKYALQPELIQKHNKTLEWISVCLLWKIELRAFQEMLDTHSGKIEGIDEKKNQDHFQNLITYYQGELVDSLRKKLRDHEKSLAHMLETRNEKDTVYFKEHERVMEELETFDSIFKKFRNAFLSWLEKFK